MITDHQREMLERLKGGGPLVRHPVGGEGVKLPSLKSLFSQGLVRCTNYPNDDYAYYKRDSIWEITEKGLDLVTERVSPLNAAWEIARREGFAAVTRERIARECGLSTGSVSYLLGGMDPIYQHILDRAYKENVRLKYK